MLRDPVQFQRLDTTSDTLGNVSAGTWANLWADKGQLLLERGREQLAAGRLQGSVMGVLVVRASTETRAITAADRVVIDSVNYNIRSNVPRDRRNGWLEMVVERGVAGTEEAPVVPDSMLWAAGDTMLWAAGDTMRWE